MKVKIQFFLLFTVFVLPLTAQDYAEVYSKDTPVKFISADAFKNLYVVTEDNAIIKYDSTGKIITSQRFLSTGGITHLDVSNALQPVVFFYNSNAVIVLDNTFSQLSDYDFTMLNISAGCRAIDGGVWVYSPTSKKIHHYSINKEDIRQSLSLTSVTGKNIYPLSMSQDEKYIYILDKQNGIILFDNFGTYVKSLPYTGANFFWVEKGNIFLQNDTELISLNPETLVVRKVNSQSFSGTGMQYIILDNLMYVSRSNGVKIYRIK